MYDICAEFFSTERCKCNVKVLNVYAKCSSLLSAKKSIVVYAMYDMFMPSIGMFMTRIIGCSFRVLLDV